MPNARHGKSVSRELAHLVRESSRVPDPTATFSRHLQVIEERRAQSVEFYLRACAMRLEQPPA